MRLLQRGNESRDLICNLLEREEIGAKQRLDVVVTAENAINVILEEAEARKREWEGFVKDHESAGAAVQEIFDIYKSEELPVGAFSSLRDAINSGHKRPFEHLYEDVYQARRCCTRMCTSQGCV